MPDRAPSRAEVDELIDRISSSVEADELLEEPPTDEEREHARALAALLRTGSAGGRGTDAPPVRDVGAQAVWETEFRLIEAWLSRQGGRQDALARGTLAPTIDLEVPRLAALGFSADVEVEVDLHEAQGLADLVIVLIPTAEGRGRLLVEVVDAAGRVRSAPVPRNGIVRVTGVAISASSPNDLRLRWVARPG